MERAQTKTTQGKKKTPNPPSRPQHHQTDAKTGLRVRKKDCHEYIWKASSATAGERTDRCCTMRARKIIFSKFQPLKGHKQRRGCVGGYRHRARKVTRPGPGSLHVPSAWRNNLQIYQLAGHNGAGVYGFLSRDLPTSAAKFGSQGVSAYFSGTGQKEGEFLREADGPGAHHWGFYL